MQLHNIHAPPVSYWEISINLPPSEDMFNIHQIFDTFPTKFTFQPAPPLAHRFARQIDNHAKPLDDGHFVDGDDDGLHTALKLRLDV